MGDCLGALEELVRGQRAATPIRGEKVDVPPPPRSSAKDGSPEVRLWLKNVACYLEAKKQPRDGWVRYAFAFLKGTASQL